MDGETWPSKLQQSVQMAIVDMENHNNLLDKSNNVGINTNNNEDKNNRNFHLQQNVQEAISEKGKQKIQSILDLVNTLSPLEKLLLYLKLPTENSLNDPLRHSLNPLGSRSEINQTITWIQTHLEEDKELSLQKKGVYIDYVAFCERNEIKPLSTADFGKVMKQVYPNVRPRRLGTRGQSKYCYSGLRSRIKLPAPHLSNIIERQMSCETNCGTSDLLMAAWIIIKEWAENRFSIQFKSITCLAFYLIKEFSAGAGLDAANLISSAMNNAQNKDDTLPFGTFSRHKETTLQLQRKLQQKCEGTREIKRKSPKIEQKSRKKFKSSSASTSCNTSPVAANKIRNHPPSQEVSSNCDSSNLQSLPDFNCFQRHSNSSNTHHKDQPVETIGENPVGKVAIPRITNQKLQPVLNLKRPKSGKCKAIQPKPEPCDTTLDSKQVLASKEPRSHESQNIREIKKGGSSPPALDPSEESTLFSRERLISIGQVSKDALDEYLGTSNSQEPEEEIMQYFGNNSEDKDTTKKISQLRQLLEKSRIAQNQNAIEVSSTTINSTNRTNLKAPFKSIIPPSFQNLNAKRRVSFDTQVHEESVPASPNTRRQNINFIPISPSSPKCSSTNASPFVSPRNTPVARMRNSVQNYPNANVICKLSNPLQLQKVKADMKPKSFKLDLINPENADDRISIKNQSLHLPMSAPPSPKINYAFNKQYPIIQPHSQKAQFTDQLSPEINQFFSNNASSNPATLNFRSQSVPLNALTNQILTSNYTNEQSPTSNEFNDLEFNNDTFSVNKIIDDISQTNLELDLNLPINQEGFEGSAGLQLNDNISMPVQQNINFIPCPIPGSSRTLGRSQSIDVKMNSEFCEIKYPSRSVPCTPLPYTSNIDLDNISEKAPSQISKSYPTTPLAPFAYNKSQDFLLNGQPIKEKCDETNTLQCDDSKANVFDIYNDGDLIDNKDNFAFDGTIADNSFIDKQGVDFY